MLFLSFPWTVLLKGIQGVRIKIVLTAKQRYTQAFLIGNTGTKVLVSCYWNGYWWHFIGCLVFAFSCLWAQCWSYCKSNKTWWNCSVTPCWVPKETLFQRQPSLEVAPSLQGHGMDLTVWAFFTVVKAWVYFAIDLSGTPHPFRAIGVLSLTIVEAELFLEKGRKDSQVNKV